MNVTGKIDSVYFDAFSNEMKAIVSINEKQTLADHYDLLKGKLLNMSFSVFRKRRSLDANAMLWACIGEIASAINTDKWEVYLHMLKRYGKYTYILVTEQAVEDVKKQWRETEVVGEVNVNGRKSVQLLCYYGSSLLDTKEFSRLLNGVVDEMQEMGLPVPASSEMRKALEKWEKDHEVNHAE